MELSAVRMREEDAGVYVDILANVQAICHQFCSSCSQNKRKHDSKWSPKKEGKEKKTTNEGQTGSCDA